MLKLLLLAATVLAASTELSSNETSSNETLSNETSGEPSSNDIVWTCTRIFCGCECKIANGNYTCNSQESNDITLTNIFGLGSYEATCALLLSTFTDGGIPGYSAGDGNNVDCAKGGPLIPVLDPSGNAISATCTYTPPATPPPTQPPTVPPPSTSPSPPPPAEPSADPPCFPSSATVQTAAGEIVPLSCLSAGDSILAAAADGTLGFDVVSSFSLADPSAKAAFLSLATAAATVTLTPTHKLPAGPAKALKQASEVAVGETIWLASPAAGTLVQEPVIEISQVVAEGLHSPLTKHGGWPVVDGVATSYNSAAVVARNKYLVPLVEAVCPSLARLVVAAANPKAMHYIDGEVFEPLSSLEAAAAVAVTATAALGARKLAAGRK